MPLKTAQEYVKEQCANGADIQFLTIPYTTHVAAMILGIPGVVNFLDQLFTHTTPRVECGTRGPEFPLLISPLKAGSILSKKAFRFLYSLGGSSLTGTSLKIAIKQALDR